MAELDWVAKVRSRPVVLRDREKSPARAATNAVVRVSPGRRVMDVKAIGADKAAAMVPLRTLAAAASLPAFLQETVPRSNNHRVSC